MIKKYILVILAILVIFGVLAGVKALQIKSMISAGANMVMPATAVTSAPVVQETWKPTLSAIGSVVAVQGVVLRAEVAGNVSRIHFESGAMANAGDLLVELDRSTEEAQLRAAEADAELGRLSLARAKDLRTKNAVSQSELESADAQFKRASAQVDSIRATVAKKTIRAPFAGRLGIRQVNEGQVLAVGDSMVSLQSLEPVYVEFSMPQQEIAKLKQGMKVRVTTDAFADHKFEGELTAINADLDAATRSIKVQATMENKDQLLRPGMYAKVEVVLPDTKTVLVIPSTAVLYAPYGDSVFVIENSKDEKSGKEQLAIRLQSVRLGETHGDFVSVNMGLKKGEKIVTTGMFKLRNGMTVEEHNEMAPDAKKAPKPSDS